MARAFETKPGRAPLPATAERLAAATRTVPPAADFPQLARRLHLGAPIQRRAGDGPGRDFSDIAGTGRPPSAGGLPAGLRADVEARSGLPMDDVRVHRHSDKPARLGALAYAQGRDIHLGPGQERHLAHEAWHVVQQKQGRVRATGWVGGLPLNDEPDLEREADRTSPQVTDRVLAMVLPVGPAPVQRQAPGPIEHAENSCFAAALVNAFVSTRALRNLLDQGGTTHLGADPQGTMLRRLLRVTVETADAGQTVHRADMQRLMVHLARTGIIADPRATGDVNHVLHAVVARLTGDSAHTAEPDGRPSIIKVEWYPDQTLHDAARLAADPTWSPTFSSPLLDSLRLPGAFHVERVTGNTDIAPARFMVMLGQHGVAYRLRTAIRHAGDDEAGHFVSFVDRGAGEADAQWWKSDDIGPHVSPIDDPRNLPAGFIPYPDEDALPRGVTGRPLKPPLSPSNDLLQSSVTYVYERADAQARDSQPEAVLGTDVQDAFLRDYEEQRAILSETAPKSIRPDIDTMSASTTSASTASATVSSSSLLLSQETAERRARRRLPPSQVLELPPIIVGSDLHSEVDRQLGLQMQALNGMTIEIWLMNLILNRFKTKEQEVTAQHANPIAVHRKIYAVLKGDGGLFANVLAQTRTRMQATLADLLKVKKSGKNTQTIAYLQKIVADLEKTASADNPRHAFEDRRMLDRLDKVSRLDLPGGIGRQSGVGDEDDVRKRFKVPVLEEEKRRKEVLAILHNPDQCIGGSMNVLGDGQASKLARGWHHYRDLDAYRQRLQDSVGEHQHAASHIEDMDEPGDEDLIQHDELEAYALPRLRDQLAELELQVEAAHEIYVHDLRDHFGGSSANSALGKVWLESISGTSESRLERMLDHALSIAPEDRSRLRMNIRMGAVCDPRRYSDVKMKTEGGLKRKTAELAAAKRPKKKSAGRVKDLDKRIKRFKTEAKQTDIKVLFRRQDQASAAQRPEDDDRDPDDLMEEDENDTTDEDDRMNEDAEARD